MFTEFTPARELEERTARLQEKMVAEGIDGALVVQRADLFYFSGTAQNAHLFIPARGEPWLLVRKNLERARQESSLQQVVAFRGWSELKKCIQASIPAGGRIGLEMDVIPATLYLRYQELFTPAEIADVSPLVRQVRAVKSLYEIRQLQAAALLGESVFTYSREVLQEGITEIELAAKLESYARSGGHQGAVRMRGFNQELFYGHILTGAGAVIPTFFDGPTGGPGPNPSYPQGAGNNRIKRNEPVLIDFVTVVNGYMVDQTRVYCLGRLPAHLERAYATALEIRDRMVSLGKPGIKAGELFNRAAEMAGQAGLAEHFMGYDEKVSFIGHGVGIELDELPVIAAKAETTLEEGMVFALEPKFMFPGEGVVGIEDTYVVREEGLEQITRFNQEIQTI